MKLIKLIIATSVILFSNIITAYTQPTLNLPNEVFYELNTRQFSKKGTFKAACKQLKRLKKMGVTTVWFMPIHPIGTTNRKGSLGSYYSISNYTAINPEFGDIESFKKFVAYAHKQGLKVIIDWVANHTSWDHTWIKSNPAYYAKDSIKNQMYSPFDWSDVVQLDFKNTALRKDMIAAMQYWISTANIDGFRCDMAHLLPIDFWKQARAEIKTNKPLIWLGETQEQNYFEAFDIIYGWEWLHKMEDYVKGTTDAAGLNDVLQMYYTDYQRGKYRLLFTSNHDENSWAGTEYERYDRWAQPLASLTMHLPGVPLIYNGQEEPIKNRIKFFDKDPIAWDAYSLNLFYKRLTGDRLLWYSKSAITTNPITDINIQTYKRDELKLTINFKNYEVVKQYRSN